jgi:DNA-binding transcriptional LysR family regulator
MQINTAISLVSAGIGIAMVPISAENVPQKGVIFRPLEERAVTELQVAHRREKISAVLQNFLGSTHEVAREMRRLSSGSKRLWVPDK